ncbi:MAG: N-formylglutamate amidohydrolase [Planctomycetota bacterium]|nr:N-formylglutamate amidohydrolase [Planctomycetota bacterium]
MIEGPLDGANFTIIPGAVPIPMILCCEHAGNVIPEEYNSLGIGAKILDDHWGWDIGAWATVLRIASKTGVTAMGSLYSRLLIDLNRSRKDETLIVDSVEGRSIPGNRNLAAVEVESRIARYYEPYHNSLARLCQAYQRHHGRAFALISIHSFTGQWSNQDRDFDLGILFDELNADVGLALVDELNKQGLRARANEPYSGMRGEIYSAEHHGSTCQILYFEIEMNQSAVNDEKKRRRIGDALSEILPRFIEQQLQRRHKTL